MQLNIFKIKIFQALLWIFVLHSNVVVQAVSPPPVPQGSLPPHPRLVLTPSRINFLLSARARNDSADIGLLFAQLQDHADYALTQPVVEHGVPGPSGILENVRRSLDLLLTSAAAHILLAVPSNSSDTRYLDRAEREVLNLCVTWADWNTVQHALDTGEALLATGLAYDWLSPYLNESTKAAIVSGIVSKGLFEYQKYIPNRTQFWWKNNSINWNCVCSSGGVVAVLALFGDPGAPSWAWNDVLQPLVNDTGVAPCVAAYNTDSSWEEGPAYWNYASKYNVWLFSSLQSALNDPSASGLLQVPGVNEAARFPIWSTGANAIPFLTQGDLPSEIFNWADSAATGEDWSPFAQWWGSSLAFNDSASAFWSRLGSRTQGPSYINNSAWGGFVEALVFYEPSGTVEELLALPTFHVFDYIDVGVFRSPFNSTQQNYISFKGGNSAWNHGHLDLGSFVMDYAGKRLAEDLGADSYNLPGYFGPQRFSYYRLNSLGHNVFLFGNESQTHPVSASIVSFNGTGNPVKEGSITLDGYSIVDLSEAYALSGGVSSARRGFISLSQSAALVIVDAFVFNNKTLPTNLTWQLHTRTNATQMTTTEVLLEPVGGGGPGSNSARLAVLLPNQPTSCFNSWGGWRFTDLKTVLPDPPFNSADGLTRIDAVFSDPSPSCTSLAFALGDSPTIAALSSGAVMVRPLDEWETLGPINFSP
jgi:hypothetical protein